MSQAVDNGYISLVPGAALEQYALVKLSSNKLALAGLAEAPIGVVDVDCYGDTDPPLARVKVRTAPGTFKVRAAGAFAKGALVYGRASGRVDDISASSAILIGTALEAATAAGDVVEVLPATTF